MKPIPQPRRSPALVRKGVIPLALLSALSSPFAINELERMEGNILAVYADKHARGLPTFCAGRTDWTAKVGTRLTSDFCKEVNKITFIEYGFSVLECTTWKHMTPRRLVGVTLFAINVGKAGACNSQAVKHINQGLTTQGCRLIAYTPSGRPNWSFADGKYMQGLHNRRKAEYQICLGDKL